jgi:hypothetical protein
MSAAVPRRGWLVRNLARRVSGQRPLALDASIAFLRISRSKKQHKPERGTPT